MKQLEGRQTARLRLEEPALVGLAPKGGTDPPLATISASKGERVVDEVASNGGALCVRDRVAAPSAVAPVAAQHSYIVEGVRSGAVSVGGCVMRSARRWSSFRLHGAFKAHTASIFSI